MTGVRFQHITKNFGETVALRDIDFSIAPGELFFLLGPSGCGKSTLLRLIAGLHEPTSGKIFFNDRDVTNLGTDQRNAVMCFQSYALWPHMTVAQNIGFGLRVRKMSPADQLKRIGEVLAMVKMEKYANRKPNALSGGQQQRIALARAMAVNPDCLLLDEPLSNLDAKLRLEMRGEIRWLCKTGKFTTIYVTHDQKEALSIADRIAVMNEGTVAQIGTPADLYYRPATKFVADFLGQTNILPATFLGRDGANLRLQTPAGNLLADGNGAVGAAGSSPGKSEKVSFISIRPESIQLIRDGRPPTPGANHWSGKLLESTFLGEASEHVLAVADQKIRVIATPPLLDPPEQMTVEFNPKDVVPLPE
jgi:iron(III) transport system ATP-binding protein